MPWPKFNKGQRRKITIFFSSLAGAVFLWLFYALSNRYTYPLTFAIEWTEGREQSGWKTLKTDSVLAKVEGSGWQLIFSKIRPDHQTLKIKNKNSHLYKFIDLKTQLISLNKQLVSGQKILSLQPETLFFDQSELISKKVPVKLYHQIKYQAAHGPSGPISLSPGWVKLSGKPADLNQIHYIETEVLRKTEVNTDFKQWVNLKTTGKKQIQIYPQQILVKVPAGRYTEKILNLDIQVHNNNTQMGLKLFPAQVKVTFSTALSNYPLIKPEDFEAFVDLELWQTKKISRLPIKFKKQPDFIRILKIEPQTVDFIINP